ncbi:MORN motif protein (macronuclear) [Tetrahymena thermophila SB210]|uniref:MORN motif protein n=1 Tax=Tetrahymena thermophila (strain SB210) TaxID=312017 RepID=Q245V0_TETTS|nr:MORN motif protein [Tetrahymena thermophila SB210]EAS03533.2 MORN motif protein [Tetrahymena thermophila SB210]|eukprot:XP_001023778.2 MORN motif protein [Tetrahymena thermophila SB210]
MEKGEDSRRFSLDSLKIKQFDSEKDVYQNNEQFTGMYNHEQEMNQQIEQTNMGVNSLSPHEEQIYSQQMANESKNKQNQFIKENYQQSYQFAEYGTNKYIHGDKLVIECNTNSVPNPLSNSSINSHNNNPNNQKADFQGQNQNENNYAGKSVNHTDVLEEDDENISFGDQSPHRNKQQNQQMSKQQNDYYNGSKNSQNYYNYGNSDRIYSPFQFKNVSQEYDDMLEDQQRRGSGGITLISQSQLYARDSIRNVDSVTERVHVSQDQLENNQISTFDQDNNKQFPFLNKQQGQQRQYQNQNQYEEYDNQFQKLIKMRTCPLDEKYPNNENKNRMPLYNYRLSNELVVSEYNSQSENLERKKSSDSDLQCKNLQNTNMQNLYTFSPRIENNNQNKTQKQMKEGNQNGQVVNENKSNKKLNLDKTQDKDNKSQVQQQRDQKINQQKRKEQIDQIDETDKQDILNDIQIKCQIKEHDGEKIIMVCVDPYCEAQYRLCCGFCNKLHSKHIHQLMRLQEYRYKILQSSKILGKSEQEQDKKEKDANKINHKELLYLCMQRQNQLYQEIKKHLDSTFLQIQKLVEDKEKNILSYISSYDEEYNYYLEKLQKLQQKDYFSLTNKDFLKLFNFQKSPEKFLEHQTINDNCRKKQLSELDDIVYDYYVDLQDIFKDCLEQSNNLLYDLLLKLTSNNIVATQARSTTPQNVSSRKVNQFSTPDKKGTQEQTTSANRNSQSPLQKFINRTAKSLLVINSNNNHMVEKGIPGHKRLEELPQWCSQMQHVTRALKKFGPYKFENVKPKSINLGMQQNIKSENVYIGDWVNFMREGNGIEYSKKDQTYYEGQWKSNLKHGNGRLVCRNDIVYEGQFEGNKKQGYGVLYQFGGKRYEGQWSNDLPNGNGIQYYPNGDIFEGEFQNGVKQGSGTFKYFDGSTLSGSWVKDQANGACTYFKIDGSKYEGEYKNGKKHGFGTFIWSDGRKYVGHWENGVQDGAGLYTNSKGITVQGIWKNGKKIQQNDSDFNKFIVR